MKIEQQKQSKRKRRQVFAIYIRLDEEPGTDRPELLNHEYRNSNREKTAVKVWTSINGSNLLVVVRKRPWVRCVHKFFGYTDLFLFCTCISVLSSWSLSLSPLSSLSCSLIKDQERKILRGEREKKRALIIYMK